MIIKPMRFMKMTAVALFTTFVAIVLILNTTGRSLAELDFFHILELFIAIPLFTSVYYLLLASKYDEFSNRISGLERSLSRVVGRLESEEEALEGEEEELTYGERALKKEIADLRRVVGRLDDDVRAMRKLVK
jgi:hypothetical protein